MALLKSFTIFNRSFVSFFSKIVLRKFAFQKVNKMNYVYLHEWEKDKEKIFVNFTFNYQTDSCKIKKDVSLYRNASDTVDIFFHRLQLKLENLFKNKKKKLQMAAMKGQETETLFEDFKLCFLSNDETLSGSTLLRDLVENNVENVKLKILDTIYSVVVNAPVINNMALPKEIFVGSVCCPVKFEGFYINKEKSTFLWYKARKVQGKWIECGTGFYYIPSDDDVNHFLKFKCIPVNDVAKEGPQYEVNSITEVSTSSGFDEISKRHEFTKKETAADEIRIVSYNVLADIYATSKEAKSKLFSYCNPDKLNIDYRKTLWNYEILGYKADLICLQEVDSKVFKSNFEPLLKFKNTKGIFCEKKAQREGCALFYNSTKFELLKSSQHSYSNEILNNPLLTDIKEKVMKSKNLVDRLDNIYSQIQVVVLKCLNNDNQVIVVGNTHMYFHPDADHIRLLQGIIGFRILLKEIEEVKKLDSKNQVSLILCGDFNTTPECAFLTLLNEGEINSSHPEWSIKKDEEIEGIVCKNPLKMKSAYGTPAYTNYTVLFKECIDYIYFQTDFLELKQIVPIPSEDILSQNLAIPSEFFPSDHVALVADLKFKNI